MDFLEGLNDAQKEAVTHESGPLLIVAGAGTGKTTVLTRRLAWLMLSGRAKPNEIVALTFTEKAAGEMEERIDQLLPLGYVDLSIGTFHAFCEQILRSHGLELGLPADFKVLDPTAAWILVRQNFSRFELDYYKPRGNPTKFIHALLQHFSRCKDELITPEQYLQFADELKLNANASEFFSRAGLVQIIEGAELSEGEKKELAASEAVRIVEVAQAYNAYQKLLLDEGALDFGDLIFQTLRLLSERPAVRAHYQNLFRHILVDEFQDTNFAQYELVELLAKPQNNITVVGDDDQSIYKFRGASVSNILTFNEDFPNAKEIVLTHNYRSAQPILDQSYAFIQANNPDRLEVKLQGRISKKLEAKGDVSVGIVHHLHFSTIDDEVCGVVDKIVELENQGAEWNDFAILVRANDSAEPFVQELGSREIPHQFLAAEGLYLQSIILDLLSYGRVLMNHFDDTNLWRVMNIPLFSIPPRDVAAITHTARKKAWPLFEALQRVSSVPDIGATTVERTGKILQLIERHASLARRSGAHVVFLAFLNDSGYLKHLAGLPELQSRAVLRDLQVFFDVVKLREQEIKGLNLRSFLELHELSLDAGDAGSRVFDPESGPDMVKIMTVHAAKGLEFPYVFIVNMVDQRFPTRERKDAIPLPDALIKERLPEGDAHLQEERRLLYVAITRAKKGVFFTSADDYGGMRKKKLSRFLHEMGLAKQEGVASVIPAKAGIQLQGKGELDPGSKPGMTERPFSYTQLKAYETCPLQYKFAHVLRVPIKGRYTFSFGKTMHATLQRFFEEARRRNQHQQVDIFGNTIGAAVLEGVVLPSEDELLKMFEACWIDEWYESAAQKKDYHDRGVAAFKKFYKEVSADPPRILHLEKPFTVKIHGHTIKGVMDRVDRVEDGVAIVDYKTGQAKSEDKVDKDQLLIYQLAMKRTFGEEPKLLTYYFIEDGERVSFIGSDKDLARVEDKVVSTIEKIQSGDFTPTPGPPCSFCDFRDICDFRVV